MRYLRKEYDDIITISISPLSVLQMLSGVKNDYKKTDISPYPFYMQHKIAVQAMHIMDYLSGARNLKLSSQVRFEAEIASLNNSECGSIDTRLWEEALNFTAMQTVTFLSAQELNKIWVKIESSPCFKSLPPHALETFRLVKAVSNRDGRAMVDIATRILKANKKISDIPYPDYILGAALLGHLATGNPDAAVALWKQYAPTIVTQKKIPAVLKFLATTAFSSLKNGSP